MRGKGKEALHENFFLDKMDASSSDMSANTVELDYNVMKGTEYFVSL
jgi:hypothetical protein